LDHVEQREREILQISNEIEDIKTIKKSQITEFQSEINELKEKVQDINDQIKSKEQIIVDFTANRIPEIVTIKAESFFLIISVDKHSQ